MYKYLMWLVGGKCGLAGIVYDNTGGAQCSFNKRCFILVKVQAVFS